MKYLLFILICIPLNAMAFNGAVIDQGYKAKMEKDAAERQRLTAEAEARKTPAERAQEKLAVLELNLSNKVDSRKTNFEREINKTCEQYTEKVRERDKWIDVMNANSYGQGQMRMDRERVPAAMAAYGYRSPFQVAEQSVHAIEGQIETIRRYSPAGLDLPSCSGNFPYGGNVYIQFSRGKVMEVTEKTSLYTLISKHNPSNLAFTMLYQSNDGKSDMAVSYNNGKLVNIMSYSNQRFNINSATGEYIFNTKNISVGQNDLPTYIEKLYRNCDFTDEKSACASTEALFTLLMSQPKFVAEAIKTISDKYLDAPTAQTTKPSIKVPQI